MTTWRCPVCRGDATLTLAGRVWRCEAAGHSFDVAKEGYVNLLVTHQRKARPPGDSVDMLRARRRFLDGGWYEPLRDAITAAATAVAGARTILDAGCGEGYYTRDLDAEVWGVDIAKEAVRLAAQRSDRHRYAVANVYDLPVVDRAVDVLVSVFAPLHSPEIERVLAAGGAAVVVTPGPSHLAGLAAVLFDHVEPHPAEPPFDRPGAATELRNTATTTVAYDVTLDAGQAADLLAMTPYSWFVDPERRSRLSTLSSLSTPVSFLVTTYQRRDSV